MRASSSATASAPGPATMTRTSVPLTAPRPMTASTLRALARRSPAASSMLVAWCRAAAWATCPAGRACRWLGRTTTRSAASETCRGSQLADIAGLLGGFGDGGQVESATGGDGGGDGALDERGIGEHDPLTVRRRVQVGQQRQGAEYRAAHVRDEQDPVAGVGGVDRRRDPLRTGAQPAVVGAAGGQDAD